MKNRRVSVSCIAVRAYGLCRDSSRIVAACVAVRNKRFSVGGCVCLSVPHKTLALCGVGLLARLKGFSSDV